MLIKSPILALAFSSIMLTSSLSYATTSRHQAPLFNNLGHLNFAISSHNPMAKRFFNQGLILYYGFEWGKSARSFKEATRLDPACGMCYWGLALAISSKVNAPLSGNEYSDAKNAISKAIALKNYETKRERAYVSALSKLLQHNPKNIISTKTDAFSCHSSNKNIDKPSPKELRHYVRLMKQLTKNYPQDNDAKALYAYALFQLIEWQFWDNNGKKNPYTSKIIKNIESVLKNDPLHYGANHYYIHAIEASPTPQDGLISANRLTNLVPGSEHMVHMPAHIYFLTGKYHQASASNMQAIEAFKGYNQTCIAQGFLPEPNYLFMHNYDFLRSTAMMEGRQRLALSAAQELLGPPFPEWLKKDDSLQWFIPIPYYVETRFALWDKILEEKAPQEHYQYALGMWHYAQGMAFAHTNQINKAKTELHQLAKIIQQGPNNKNLQKKGIQLLKIAQAVLDANIANITNNKHITISQLTNALKMQTAMGYHEPPDWYFPVREMLADAYLKWNAPLQALKLYQQNLEQYPDNGWALFGMANSLRKLGRTAEAAQTDKKFTQAWRYADSKTPVSLI